MQLTGKFVMYPQRFNNRLIANLYTQLHHHYLDCKKRNLSDSELCYELDSQIYHTFPWGALAEEDHHYVYKILHIFLDASSAHLMASQLQKNDELTGERRPVVILTPYNYNRVCDDHLFFMAFAPQSFPVIHMHEHGSAHSHTHQHPSEEDKKKQGSVLAAIALIILGTLAAGLAFIAMYYLLNQLLSSGERFYYHEGWLQAGLSLLYMAVSATASTLLGALLVPALTSLVVSAGIGNPVFLVALGVIAITLIGTAFGTLIANAIQQAIIEKSNANALEPKDPYRFNLTERECLKLDEMGVDPLKVKCAIVALRMQLGEGGVPSYMNRLFSEKKEIINEVLEKVRKLRRGELTEVIVGDMSFDCRKDLPMFVPTAPPFNPEYVPQYSDQLNYPQDNPSMSFMPQTQFSFNMNY